MRKKNIFYMAIGALLLLPAITSAQYIVDYKRQGDTYFAQHNYYGAAVLYQKALNLLPDTSGKTYFYPYAMKTTFGKRKEKNADQYEYLVYQLGESFRLYKDYASAEPWYEKVLQFNNDKFPLARLWYAVCLRSDQKYADAISQLDQFQASYTKQDACSQRAGLELKSCRFALDQMAFSRLAHIQKLPTPINDSGSAYAPVITDTTLYFTSSRPLSSINPRKANPYVNKIYKAGISGGNSFDKPVMITLGSDPTTELAAQSLSPGYTRMYFTEWQQPKRKKDSQAHYEITMSRMGSDSVWSAPVSVGGFVNVQGYDSKEAFATPDGQYLIFSSDRPGGQGGYDLWYCPLNLDGMPSGDAVNMGVVINTSGDEASPYYNSKTGELVFSSNGRVGLGGFDLYESDGTIGAGKWSEPKDLGYPVNSAKDDNFYYPSGKEGNFYTSSDRESVCCMELFNIQLSHIAITGTVRDCDSAKPLPGVEVTLTDSISHKTIGSQLTDDAGHYRFTVINRKPLKLHFDKDEYFSKSAIITTNDLSQVDTLFSNEICMNHFVIGKPIVIPNIEYDFNKATLRPESESVLDSLAQILKDNPKLIVQMRSYTDSIGSFDYNRKLSQRRAQSCVDYLLSQGIPSYRMSAKGYGETDPIAPNSLPDGKDNPAGRQKNRRTAFVVLKD
ncbi:MAG: hypothetical protein EPN39_05050 [Chitinophagaceae bacterium]|nr:MAG: hypothetical protein EPN39_05050 [Chitinophagaceae bacterium]